MTIPTGNEKLKGHFMKALRFLILATGASWQPTAPARATLPKAISTNSRGTWLTVSLVNDGKTLVDEKTPPKEGPATKLVYDGNKWMIKVGDKTVASGEFRIDATKTPKEIDIMDETGVKNDKTKLGIYELEGDTYKYCLAPAGKPRPTSFTCKAGSAHSLGVSSARCRRCGFQTLRSNIR